MNESTPTTDEKKKSQILLVDDEPGLRNAVKLFLRMKDLRSLLLLMERWLGKSPEVIS